jgi:hypothetical protein
VRLAVIVAIVGCGGAEHAQPMIAHRTAGAAIPAFDDGAWQLRGDATLDSGALVLPHGCKASGMASRRLGPLAPGRHAIAIAHANTECRTGTVVAVGSRRGGVIARVVLDAGPRGGVARLELAVASIDDLQLEIVADGGLHCWGTTRVERVEVK